MAVERLETRKAMKIGVDNVVACKISDNDNKYEVISEVIALPGAMAMNVNANFSLETAFFDNGPGELAISLGVIEVTFNKSALGPKEKSWLLGLNEIEKSKEIAYSQNNVAPWIALGFRSLRSDGSYRYVWMLKGKFSLPEDNNETKADSINFQSEELTGRFVTTEFAFPTKDGSSDATHKKLWKVEMDSSLIDELDDADKKASAQLMVNGWEYLVNNLEKATEGKTFKPAKTVKVKKADGTDITTTGWDIPNNDRGKIFQVFGSAEPATRADGDNTCIQAFAYWECKTQTDYDPPSTASFNNYGNGKFSFKEKGTTPAVTAYIACQAIFGETNAKKIIKVTSPATSSSKTVDYQDKK
ncbi:MAG: major tail protein [Paraclostridium sp.]